MKKMSHHVYRSILLFVVLSFSQKGNAQTSNGSDSGAYFRSFDNTRIYYEIKGNGEPILLVHGFIVNGQSWKRTDLYKDLLTAGYKVIFI